MHLSTPDDPTPEQHEDVGAKSRVEELIPLVHAELRNLAAWYLKGERRHHTLQATALVHEAYLRIASTHQAAFSDRSEFLKAAAVAMRRILVNYARDRCRVKRGGGAASVRLEGNEIGPPGSDPDIIDLDAALSRLAVIHPRKAEIVHLRYFAGLTIDEAATATNLSVAQVKRDWLFAKAWLQRELNREAHRESHSEGHP